jgi:UDP:flavonoid glycosyltransferase YjiC (YdhE family)
MIAVYRCLLERGTDAVIATHGGTYEFLLEQEDIPYDVVQPEMDHERCSEFVKANIPQSGLRAMRGLRFYQTEELMEHVTKEVEYFRDEEIKVVLSGFTLSNILSTRIAGVHYAVTHLGSFVPPIFERKMLSPRKDFSLITKLMRSSWTRRMMNWMYLRSNFYTKQFNEVAREFGVDPVRTTLDLFMGDTTYITDCPEILGISSYDIENWVPKYPKAFSRESPKLKYVGPIYSKLFGDIPEDVNEFLQTDKQKVYVALTSSDFEWIKAAYSTIMEMDVVTVFVTTVHPNEFDPVPRILVKEHLPSHLVMPLVDATVIHGGQGSVQSAIASGTPFVGIPLQTEQHFNVNIVEQHGAGLSLTIKQLLKGHLRTKLEQVLSDERYTVEMKRLQSLQEQYNGPDNTARDLIEIHKTIENAQLN